MIDDVAAKLGKDSYDVFVANLANCTNGKAAVYAEEMKIAARLMDWKDKWHAHGKGPSNGSVAKGLGMAFHTWGEAAHPLTCTVKIHPDEGVEASLETASHPRSAMLLPTLSAFAFRPFQ